MREGIRSARRLYSTPIFKDSVLGTALPGKEVVSDEDLDVYIRNITTTFTHSAGSAAMSSRGASWGVIDPDCRVKGTDGLRVVDASVLVSLDCIYLFIFVLVIAHCCTAISPERTHAGIGVCRRRMGECGH
jgi:choline dehydrogenase-like flavoprotein